jgi:putative acetyltransferase
VIDEPCFYGLEVPDAAAVKSLDAHALADDDPSVELDIRPERHEDQAAIRRVVRAAFDKHTSVADLVELIRESPEFVPGLSLIASHSGQVVGHVMLSHAELVDEHGVRRRILELSPLAVAPALQRRGIGSALVPAGLAAAEAMGEPLVVLQGSPDYYPRFGFRDCRTLGIEIDLPDWAPPDAGMAYPLTTYDPSLRGRLIEPPAFAAVG